MSCKCNVRKCDQSTQYEQQAMSQRAEQQFSRVTGFNDVDKTSHKYRVADSLTDVPSKLVDIQFNKRKELIVVDQNFNVYNASGARLFNQYVSEEIDVHDRVSQGQPEFIEKKSLLNYAFDTYSIENAATNGQNTKLGTKQTVDGILSKFMCENEQIEFTYPTIIPIYWDIETFNTQHHGVPLYTEEHSHISMICAVRLDHVKVWLYNDYTYNITTISQKLMNHIDKNFTFEIIECCDDRQMSRQFISWLKSLQQPHYLCGFNATQAKQENSNLYYRKPKCYDMNFIIQKGGLDVNLFQTTQQKWCNQQELAYSSYAPLPLIIIIDFKQLAQGEVSISESKLSGYSLNNILGFLGIKQKIEVNHIQMAKHSRISGFDMSEYIAYCAFDCICLSLADQKHELFQQQYELIKLLQLPLFAISNLTNAKKVQIRLLKEYYKNKYSFHYSNVVYKEEKTKYGAQTEDVDKALQFQHLDKVVSCDYTSQYPNAILQYNIAPENISLTPTQYGIDINYLKGEQQMVYFNDKESVMAPLVRLFLSQKKQFKSEGKKPQEKAVKLCVNTIYGITNQNTNPLYNYKSASAITGFGRMSVTYAKQLFQEANYTILSVDTDGIEVQANQDTIVSPQQIADQIKNRWSNMVLEIKENIEFIFNDKKKAYLKCDGGDIEMKGFGSKNALSLYMRNRIIQFCQNLMKSKPANLDQILLKIQQFRTTIKQEVIETIVAGRSLDSFVLFQKFTKERNASGELTKSGKLQERYGDKSVYKILPYNFNETRKDFNFAEYSEKLDIKGVQLEVLIDLLIKPLTQFFQVKNETASLKSKLKEGQLMLRVQQLNQPNKMINVNIEEIEGLVMDTRHECVYHEKILNDRCKLYFDLETKKTKDCELVMIDIEKFKQILWQSLEQVYPIHIASGCVANEKQSYHAIVDVVMIKSQMRSLAKLINQKYQYSICDLAVYKEKDQSMRLPLQYKFIKDTNQLSTKMLTIITHSKFSDFIVQNTLLQHINLINPIAFCSKSHFGKRAIKQQNSQALQYLKQYHNLDCALQDYNLIPQRKPFRCPLSNKMHESQNLYVIGDQIKCHSERCKGLKIELPSEKPIENQYCPPQLKDCILVNSRQVTYNTTPYKFSYIKSQMNTGKTYHLRGELEKYQENYQIAISFRRTFAQDFGQKMGFVNYQDIKSSISLRQYPKVVVQIDSLHRIKLDGVNKREIVLVLDEIESILDQSQAFSYKPQVQQSFLILVDLLQNSKKVIVLDALMQDQTIWLLNTIARNENYQAIHNTYMPKTGKTVNLIKDRHTNQFKADFQQTIVQKLMEGNKVVSFCSSREVASGVVQMAAKLGKTVKFYHGKDTEFEECHNGKNMITAKTHDFQNLENLTVDLFIYTSTITAGISYEANHYNSSINYYAFNTCSPIQVIQALQRVRNITDNEITIYLDETQSNLPLQTAQAISEQKIVAYDKFNIYDLYQEMSIYLDARMNEQYSQKNTILIDLLKDQGYSINLVQKQYTEEQMNVVSIGYDYGIQLSNEDLQLLERSKQQDFLLNNPDTQLTSKLQLVHIYNLYKTTYTLEQFNALTPECKQELYSKKQQQIELLAWQSLMSQYELNSLDVESAIKICRKREEQINIQANWTAEVQNTLTQKQRDVYLKRLQYLVHCQQLMGQDEESVTKYIQDLKNEKFVKIFNELLETPFGCRINVRRLRQNGEIVKKYSLEKQ